MRGGPTLARVGLAWSRLREVDDRRMSDGVNVTRTTVRQVSALTCAVTSALTQTIAYHRNRIGDLYCLALIQAASTRVAPAAQLLAGRYGRRAPNLNASVPPCEPTACIRPGVNAPSCTVCATSGPGTASRPCSAQDAAVRPMLARRLPRRSANSTSGGHERGNVAGACSPLESVRARSCHRPHAPTLSPSGSRGEFAVSGRARMTRTMYIPR